MGNFWDMANGQPDWSQLARPVDPRQGGGEMSFGGGSRADPSLMARAIQSVNVGGSNSEVPGMNRYDLSAELPGGMYLEGSRQLSPHGQNMLRAMLGYRGQF